MAVGLDVAFLAEGLGLPANCFLPAAALGDALAVRVVALVVVAFLAGADLDLGAAVLDVDALEAVFEAGLEF